MVLGEVTKNMFLKTLFFIMFLNVSKVHLSKINDATSAVSFDRLELQTKKDSKYIIVIFTLNIYIFYKHIQYVI